MALLMAGSAWLLGLILASITSLQLWHWLVLVLSAVLSAIAFRSDRHYRTLFLLLGSLCLGAARWESADPRIDPDHVAYYADIPTELQITGQIAADPDVHDRQTRLEIETERLWIPDLGIQKHIHGAILVTTPPLKTFQYGERLKLTGLLELPPQAGDFSYREYLARQGILAWMPDAQIRSLGPGKTNRLLASLYRLRAAAFKEIHRLFPYPEAPLIAGILLGIESYIPETLSQAFSHTGTTHIIAISGFNITIMAGLAIAVLGRGLGRVRGLFFAGLLILLYTIFVGGDAPVVRAAIMGMVALLARYLGRRTHGLTSLVAAAFAMTMVQPQSIQDVGFQLSFAATLGLILYADPLTRITIQLLQRHFPRQDTKRWGGVIAEVLLYTFSAQLTTLPIIVWHFHQISITSLAANALILPLQPLLMILSGMATTLGLVFHPLGQLIAWFAWPFSALTNRLVTILASLPGGVVYSGAIRPVYILTYYTLLFLITAVQFSPWKIKIAGLFHWLPSLRQALSRSTTLSILALASILIWTSLSRQPDGRLHVTILNVGQGDSILIQAPSGARILANGGSSAVKLGSELGRHLPYPDRSVDWLIVAGTQYDQLAGLREISSMTQLGHVLMGGEGSNSAYTKLMDQIAAAGIPIESAMAGQVLDLGNGALLEVLTTGPKGISFLLSFGNARMLFPMGLSPGEISTLLANERTANLDAILLADSGYVAVNPSSLLAHFNPRVIVISCEAGACPDPSLLGETIASRNVLSTDLYGSVELATDGQSLWITTEFNPDVDPSR